MDIGGTVIQHKWSYLTNINIQYAVYFTVNKDMHD